MQQEHLQDTAPSQKVKQLMITEEQVEDIHDFLNYSLSDGYYSIEGSRTKKAAPTINNNNSLQSSSDDRLAHLDSLPNSPTNKLITPNNRNSKQEHNKGLIQYFHIKRFLTRINWRKKMNGMFNLYHYTIIDDKGSSYNQKLFRDNTLKFKPMMQLHQTEFRIRHNYLVSRIKKLYKRLSYEIVALYKRIEAYIDTVPLINPEARWKIIWDFAIMLARLYFMFVIPVDLAWKHIQYIYGILYVPSVMMIVLLVIDFGLSFNNKFYQFGQIVDKRSKIAKHVVTKSYGLEALSLLILVIFAIVNINSDYKFDISAEWYDLLVLIFYVQSRNIPKFIHQVEEALNLSKPVSSMLELLKLILVLFFVMHFYSCLWYWVGAYSHDNQLSGNWLETQHVLTETWQIQYLYSFYFSTVTMFTIGYGDVIPVSHLERIVAILYMMICSIQLSYSVSTVGAIIDKISAYEQEKMKKVQTITTYMQNKKISYELQFQVREYLNYYWQAESQEGTEEELQIMGQLSENLREKLVIEANSLILNQCSLFKEHFSEPLKKKLVRKIQSAVIQPENVIEFDELLPGTAKGQIFICFVEQGDIEIFIQNEANVLLNDNPQISIVSKVGKGSSLGLSGFITGQKTPERYRSLGFTKLLLLSREDFLKTVHDFPEDYEKFRNLYDSLVNNEDQTFLNMKCFSCDSKHHRVIHCPLLHFIPDRELVIKSHVYSHNQERAPHHRNPNRQRSLFGALVDCEIVREQAQSFQNDNWKWGEFYDEPPEEEQVIQGAAGGNSNAVNSAPINPVNTINVNPTSSKQLDYEPPNIPNLEPPVPKKKSALLMRQRTKQYGGDDDIKKPRDSVFGGHFPPILEEDTNEHSPRQRKKKVTLEPLKGKLSTPMLKLKNVFESVRQFKLLEKKNLKKSCSRVLMNSFLDQVQKELFLKSQIHKVKIRLENISEGKKQILSDADVQDCYQLQLRLNLEMQLHQEYHRKDTQLALDLCKQYKYYQQHNNFDQIMEKEKFYHAQNQEVPHLGEFQSRLLKYMIYPSIYLVKYKYVQPQILKKQVILKEQSMRDQSDESQSIKLFKRNKILQKKSFRKVTPTTMRPASDGMMMTTMRKPK